MTQPVNLQFSEIKETTYGLRELNDFTNLFGYNVKLPCETIGALRFQTKEEIAKDYPLAYKYLEGVKGLTSHLKSFGSGKDVLSFKFRTNHIEAMKEFLGVASRLQFLKALEDQIGVYQKENIGWGTFNLKTKFINGALSEHKVFIGDEDITDRLPLRIHAIDWYGRLREGLQIINTNAGLTKKELARGEDNEVIMDEKGKAVYNEVPLPVDIAIQITEDSVSNQEYVDMIAKRNGEINKTKISETLMFSPLQYLVMRIADDEKDIENDVAINGYDTPIFKVLDYSLEIPFLEHIRVLEKHKQMVDLDTFFNSREFATLNLLRWGIVDKASWDRGLKIFNAVVNSKPLWGVDTIIDGKVVKWANEVIAELEQRAENKGQTIRDDVVVSGSAISKIASVSSQSYFRVRALVVDSIDEENNDINFRDTFVTFRYQREITNKFQSMPRLNTLVYKIIECDKDGNMIRVINPVDVFAIANHDITAVVVRLDASFSAGGVGGEITPNEEHAKYYNDLVTFKTPE